MLRKNVSHAVLVSDAKIILPKHFHTLFVLLWVLFSDRTCVGKYMLILDITSNPSIRESSIHTICFQRKDTCLTKSMAKRY